MFVKTHLGSLLLTIKLDILTLENFDKFYLTGWANLFYNDSSILIPLKYKNMIIRETNNYGDRNLIPHIAYEGKIPTSDLDIPSLNSNIAECKLKYCGIDNIKLNCYKFSIVDVQSSYDNFIQIIAY